MRSRAFFDIGRGYTYNVCNACDLYRRGGIRLSRGVIAVLIYIVLGACGVPVFSGFKAGAQVLAGATGGYIVGYVFLALIEGVIIDKFEDKKFVYPLAMVLGTAVLYAFGTAWFIAIMKTTFVAALLTCVVPFLVGDALKIAAATAISLPLRAAVKKVAVSRV